MIILMQECRWPYDIAWYFNTSIAWAFLAMVRVTNDFWLGFRFGKESRAKMRKERQ